MQQLTIECPSGLSGTVRDMTVESAGILADPKLVRTGKAADAILRKCWVETHDAGPYDAAGGLDWGHVLACDRVYAIVMVRVATYGQTEELDMRCQSCAKKFVWQLPLAELPVKPLPQSSREKIAARDNSFSAEVGGQEVRFRLVTGHDQHKAAKMARDGGVDIMAAALSQRVVSVEGVEAQDLPAWVRSLGLGQSQELIDAFDEADGGIDTLFDVECPSCQARWEVDLPLDLERMFAPKRGGRRRRGVPVAGPLT